MRQLVVCFNVGKLVSVKPVGHKILYLWPLNTSAEADDLVSKEIPSFDPVIKKGKLVAFFPSGMAGH